MIRGLGSDEGGGSRTAVPFAVETLFKLMSLFEVFDGEVPLVVGIEEPGSFR